MIKKKCIYKNRFYTVLDNGLVMRHPKEGGRKSKLDNCWTFGKVNSNGYLTIGSEMVHRIVATAFLGEAPSDQHIVDHIDTNRQNNRPENLRWLTKLENVLLNPYTVKKIEYKCGSVEQFLENIDQYREIFSEPNLSWMRNVSIAEANNTLKNLNNWISSKTKNPLKSKSIGEWVYYNRQEVIPSFEEEILALSPNSIQIGRTKYPLNFLQVPHILSDTPLIDYYHNLKEGIVFSENQFNTDVVIEAIYVDQDDKILVRTKRIDYANKPWVVVEIHFENDFFIHNLIGSYFEEMGAIKNYTIQQGIEWEGEQTFDDYC